MTDDELRELAKKIIQTAHHHYEAGDCCPCCGYDGLWPSSLDAAVDTVFEMLEKAVKTPEGK